MSNELNINDYWAQMLGYTKKELNPVTYETWRSLTFSEDIEKANEQIKKVLDGEKDFYDIEIRMKHKNGNIVWVHDRGKITRKSKNSKSILMSGTHTDITEKKLSREKTIYYHNLMSYVIDHMNSGIAVHDKDLNYVYVSKKYLEEYNINEDLIGKNHYDVFPDLPQKWRDVHQRCLKGEILSADRDPYIHKDGRIDITRWECRPWYDERGNIGGIIVYTEVINDFITIEEELKNSKEMLQLVMDQMPIGVALISLEAGMKFSYMNSEFPKCYNRTMEELQNNNFWEVVYEDKTFRDEMKNKVIEGVKSNDAKKRIWTDIPLTKDGEIVKYVSSIVKALPNQNQIISLAIDTTVRKKLELDLIEKANEMYIQKETIEATLLSIDDAVISTDAFGKIISFNRIAEELTGYKRKDVSGKTFCDIFEILNEITGEKLACPTERVISSGKKISLENHSIIFFKDQKKHYIEYNAAPIRNQDNKLIGVILVIRDVTESKQKQREIEYLSIHDYLTGLFNRRFFTEKLSEMDKNKLYPLGILMIDVNGLKIVNDAFGHDIGDKVLVNVSNVLKNHSAKKGIPSRIGGDEFAILLQKTSEEEILELRDNINKAISEITINNISLSVSIGYALKKSEEVDINEIMRDSENLMYKFKLTDGASARNHAIQAIYKTLTDKFVLERIHSERVAELSAKMGEALEMRSEDIKELRLSGLFHDIGKISIPDSILYKPGKLTDLEYEQIKEHPRNGYMILKAADEYSDLAKNALFHHERWDGFGYPEGLKGERIPLQSRIICVVDAFEAMTADRPYRKAMSYEKSVEELIKNKGTQFDPELVDVFVEKVLQMKVEVKKAS
jgi:diguanylate cyclase (GGDEF)-like protein/PAS domain S-box-containing protein